jgi:2-polyprenyl-3-methyl-5-hydroxy-6-metoxy-1,4-benzoquinol methylase
MNAAAALNPKVTEAAWPSDGLEPLDRCPCCNGFGRQMLHAELGDRIFHCAPGSWSMARCTDCGSGYLDPRPSEDTIGLAYAEYYTHAANPEPVWLSSSTRAGARLPSWRNGYLNRRFPRLGLGPSSRWGAFLFRLFPYTRIFAERDVRHLAAPASDSRLLDIGCGDGNFLKIASRLGYAAEGLEFDRQAVRAARSSGLTVHHGSLPRTGLPSGRWDVVTLSQVIEHVHDPVASLREIARLLRPGGTLWLATPNVDAPGHARFGPHWRGLEPPRHLAIFSSQALRNCLEKVGFDDVRFRPPGPVSAWFYGASRKIAVEAGRGPVARTGRFTAAWNDLRSMLWSTSGEELIVTARRPGEQISQ